MTGVSVARDCGMIAAGEQVVMLTAAAPAEGSPTLTAMVIDESSQVSGCFRTSIAFLEEIVTATMNRYYEESINLTLF